MDADLPTGKQTISEIEATLKLAAAFARTGAMYTFKPNKKQKEHLLSGVSFPERLLKAGNQNGKTICAGYETALHMTGFYPSWWTGYRFDRPVRVWIAGISALLTRDGPQAILLGNPASPEALGTGMIPAELIVGKPTSSRSVTDGVDTFVVKHVSGGQSTATFKAYEQGREKFQSEKVDIIWLDEEPPLDIYTECMTRTTVSEGIIYMTFTPLGGWTPVVERFLKEKPPGTHVTSMTIYDAEHISDRRKAEMIARWPMHERKARAMGEPYLGSNAVFEEVDPDVLKVPLTLLPNGDVCHKEHGVIDTSAWFKLWSIDFGISHPFGATLLAWDKEYDSIYVMKCLRIGSTIAVPGIPKVHAERMKAIAAAVPVAWPHDGHQRDKGSGIELMQSYKKEGLLMLPTHATFPTGGYGTEAGVREMLVRMRSQRFFVFEDQREWFEEAASYYRKDGLIVKKGDDILSATRIGVMQIRSAKQVALGSKRPDPKGRGSGVARDVDFDLF